MWNLKENFFAAQVDARIAVPTYRDPFGQYDGERTAQRTRLVVDSLGQDVGHVTDRYSLVRNPEVAAATELLAERHGLNLEGWKSQYNAGATCLVWKDARPLRVSGDSSVLHPMVRLINSYRGDRPLEMDLVICRYICQNALIWGSTYEVKVVQRHVGTIDLHELLDPVLMRLADQVSIIELQMDVLQRTTLPSSSPVWVEVKKDTPERYHDGLGRAIRENARTLGWTAYSALQAVSEVGSNQMRGWAAADWTKRQTTRILKTDEVLGAEVAVG